MNRKVRAGGENSPGARAARGSAIRAAMQSKREHMLWLHGFLRVRIWNVGVLAIGTRSEASRSGEAAAEGDEVKHRPGFVHISALLGVKDGFIKLVAFGSEGARRHLPQKH